MSGRTVRVPPLRLPTMRSVREVALIVGGFGWLSAAAWDLARPAGMAAVGVSLLCVEWLSRADPAPGGGR